MSLGYLWGWCNLQHSSFSIFFFSTHNIFFSVGSSIYFPGPLHLKDISSPFLLGHVQMVLQALCAGNRGRIQRFWGALCQMCWEVADGDRLSWGPTWDTGYLQGVLLVGDVGITLIRQDTWSCWQAAQVRRCHLSTGEHKRWQQMAGKNVVVRSEKGGESKITGWCLYTCGWTWAK